MEPSLKFNFIVVDDSKLDCFIAEKIIRNTGRSNKVTTFLQAKDALEYIANNTYEVDEHNIMLVDIQMPVMNGFDLVEAFEKLPEYIRAKYTVYIISSSINENDLIRANEYVSVKKFINKPLTMAYLNSILG